MYEDFNKECINKFGDNIGSNIFSFFGSKETTEKYKCAEMYTIFCANDDTIFSGFAPNIIFKRNSILANGSEKCDFHFINDKYMECLNKRY